MTKLEQVIRPHPLTSILILKGEDVIGKPRMTQKDSFSPIFTFEREKVGMRGL